MKKKQQKEKILFYKDVVITLDTVDYSYLMIFLKNSNKHLYEVVLQNSKAEDEK